MSTAKRYTEVQLRKQVVEAFRIGLAIGEKRAARSVTEISVSPSDLGVRHLRLIRGGVA